MLLLDASNGVAGHLWRLLTQNLEALLKILDLLLRLSQVFIISIDGLLVVALLGHLRQHLQNHLLCRIDVTQFVHKQLFCCLYGHEKILPVFSFSFSSRLLPYVHSITAILDRSVYPVLSFTGSYLPCVYYVTQPEKKTCLHGTEAHGTIQVRL